MSSLGEELQQTIQNLVKIRDSQKPPSDDVLALLDQLYEKQLELIDAAINSATEKYKSAVKEMKEAAKKTKEAIDGLAKLEQAVDKVAAAIGTVTKLLARVT